MKLALVVVLLLAAAPAHAETQVWDSVTALARQREGSGFVGWLDLHARRRSGSTLYIARPALGYALTSRLALFAGYAWVPIDPDTGPTISEHRLWQQALWAPSLSDAIKLQLRPRIEERWLVDDDQVAFRLRVLGRGQWTPAKQRFQLVVWDELFLGFNDTEQIRRGFDQNRLFLGAGVGTELDGLRVEAGYLNVQFGGDKQTDHVLAVNVFVNVLVGE